MQSSNSSKHNTTTAFVLAVSFPDNLDKPVLEFQTVLDIIAANDVGVMMTMGTLEDVQSFKQITIKQFLSGQMLFMLMADERHGNSPPR